MERNNAQLTVRSGNIQGDKAIVLTYLESRGTSKFVGHVTFCDGVTFAGNITFLKNVTVNGNFTVGGLTTLEDLCVNGTISVNNIVEKTANNGVFIESVHLRDNIVTADSFCANVNVQTDFVVEKTLDHGVDVDGVLLKDGEVFADKLTADIVCATVEVQTDKIVEKTPGNGVLVEDVLIKDDDISQVDNLFAQKVCASTHVQTDLIIEKTLDNGVVIDGVLLKDSNVTATDVCVNNELFVDQIWEKTLDHGVLVENVLIKDFNISQVDTLFAEAVCTSAHVQTDLIIEKTLDNGIQIDQILVKDHNISEVDTLFAEAVCTTAHVQTDLIIEKTLDNGVVIDGVLLKDQDGFFRDVCVSRNFIIDYIKEKTPDHGVDIDGVRLRDGDVEISVTNILYTDTILETSMDQGVNVDGVVLKDGDVCVTAGHKVLTDTIIEKTPGNGVEIEGVLIKDGNINLPGLVSNDVVCAEIKVQTDLIQEKTLDSGVTVDGVLCKDNTVTANTLCANSSVLTDLIGEKTVGAGVTIDGVLIKDGMVTAPGGVSNDIISASNRVRTDIVQEYTLDAGVTVDGVLLKDGNVTGEILCANNKVQTNVIEEKTGGGGITFAHNAFLSAGFTVNGNMVLGDAGADTIIVNAGIASAVLPNVDNLRDLGSVAQRWRALYAATLNATDLCLDGMLLTDTIAEKTGGSGITLVNDAHLSADLDVAGTSTFNGLVVAANTTDSTDKDTGSIVVEGGVGIEKNLNVGGNFGVVGNATINGKLTVDGLIDPTGLVLDEQAAVPSVTAAGKGTVWVRNDTPNVLVFTDDAGTNHDIQFVGAVDHGALMGLTDDDHTQYALLVGRAGGQTLTGGTLVTQSLNLRGNVSALDGSVVVQDQTQSSSKDTGALIVDGGVGIEKNVYVGGALDVTGNAHVAGKLTVDGLIDPTGLVLDEQASVPAAAVAGKATLWVRDDSPNVLVFTDDVGTDHTIPLGSSGVDHGGLSGLADDDHPQYILGAGRAGGQTLYGSTVVSQNLTLWANSNAPDGSVIVATTTQSTSKDTGALVVEGGVGIEKDLFVGGKLTVTGLIDPTGLVLDEQVVAPAAPVAGKGLLWVRNDVPNNLVFTDDAGASHDVMYKDSDHGVLAGLADDDHLQYALLAGRAGGQSFSGSNAAGQNLTLRANAAALDGSVVVSTTTQSTSAITGAFVSLGGVGVAKDLYVGGSTTLGDAGADVLTVNATLAASGIKGATATSFVPLILDAEAQAITGGGAINVTSYYTAVSTAAAEAYSLANGTMVGQLKVIRMVADTGDATITPATALASGATTITLNDVGDEVKLMWNGTNWRVLKNLGATIA